ncbi:MAG TPA: 6-phosphogluconolactonase [Candidatus Angelobacter sp.]|nr:6-phosphogluconolactonase [Candidatus Angelobacter sp.]
MTPEIKILPDSAALNLAAAQEFGTAAEQAIAQHGRFSVALSGGNTPRSVYSLLAQQYKTSLPWDKIHIFFGDERSVPPDHPDSNYRMANEALLSHVPVPPENVHRIHAELDPEAAAKDYESQLRSFFQLANNAWPRFDLIMLGLGDDGHTASLFPGSSALGENFRLVVPTWVEKKKTFRVTLTYPVLNHAAEVEFLVSGSSKAEILRDVLNPSGSETFPAQLIKPDSGCVLWLLDQVAASLLPQNPA